MKNRSLFPSRIVKNKNFDLGIIHNVHLMTCTSWTHANSIFWAQLLFCFQLSTCFVAYFKTLFMESPWWKYFYLFFCMYHLSVSPSFFTIPLWIIFKISTISRQVSSRQNSHDRNSISYEKCSKKFSFVR